MKEVKKKYQQNYIQVIYEQHNTSLCLHMWYTKWTKKAMQFVCTIKISSAIKSDLRQMCQMPRERFSISDESICYEVRTEWNYQEVEAHSLHVSAMLLQEELFLNHVLTCSEKWVLCSSSKWQHFLFVSWRTSSARSQAWLKWMKGSAMPLVDFGWNCALRAFATWTNQYCCSLLSPAGQSQWCSSPESAWAGY